MLTVRIREGKEKLLLKHHPWVFSGAIESKKGDSCGFAEVVTHSGEFIAYGYYDEKSHIILHLLSWNIDDKMDDDFIRSLVKASILRRKALFGKKDTTCLRIIHGEADFLPGVAADCYGREIRILVSSRFASSFLGVIAAELDAVLHPSAPFPGHGVSLLYHLLTESYLLTESKCSFVHYLGCILAVGTDCHVAIISLPKQDSFRLGQVANLGLMCNWTATTDRT